MHVQTTHTIHEVRKLTRWPSLIPRPITVESGNENKDNHDMHSINNYGISFDHAVTVT